MSPSQRDRRHAARPIFAQAVGYKDKGNACIAAGDSGGALKHYERGVKIAGSLGSDDQVRGLLVSLRLNLALACTKEGRCAEAEAAASKVLEVEPGNVKVRAHVAKSHYVMTCTSEQRQLLALPLE